MGENDIRMTRNIITREEESGAIPAIDNGTADNMRTACRSETECSTTWGVLCAGKDNGFPVPLSQVTRFGTECLEAIDERADACPVRPGAKAGKYTRNQNIISREIPPLSSIHGVHQFSGFLKLSGITKQQRSDHVTG